VSYHDDREKNSPENNTAVASAGSKRCVNVCLSGSISQSVKSVDRNCLSSKASLPILQEIWNKHKCTGNHIPFHMFVVYRVKSGDDFYGIP